MAARLTTLVVVAIVAATFIAGLIVGAQRDDSDGPVDLIVHNARVYTATAGGTMAEAVAIRGNQILRVGGEREIMRLQRPQTMLIDAHGAAVLPGLNDSRVELIGGGVALDQIDLLDASTQEEIERRVRDWADANPDRPWVLGRGWRLSALGAAGPTRQLLDRLVPDRPARLVSADGQSAWVNSKALAAAKIHARASSHSTEIAGAITGDLMARVAAAVPAPRQEERNRALRAAVAEAHRYGITSIQDPSATAEELEAYSEARRAGDLTVRVYSALPVGGDPSDAALAAIAGTLERYPDDPLFKAGAVSMSVDGPLETQAAALLDNYESRAAAGDTALDADALNRVVRRLDAKDWQIELRATGDRGNRMALDAFTHAVRSNPSRKAERRHRIDGAALVSATDRARFKAAGVSASLQPASAAPDADQVGLWTKLVGPARAENLWSLQSLVSAGARLAFGSGWPAAPLNPMLGLHVAVNRTTADGMPDDGWQPAERMSLKSAIDAYTSTPAWLSLDDQRKGTLEAGMLADLVILSRDIFKAPSSQLAATTVDYTIFDGKVVYRRAQAGTN